MVLQYIILPTTPLLYQHITNKNTPTPTQILTNNKWLHQLSLAIIPGGAASCVDGAPATPQDGLSAP